MLFTDEDTGARNSLANFRKNLWACIFQTGFRVGTGKAEVKNILLALALAASPAMAQEPAPQPAEKPIKIPTFVPGTEAKLEALKSATWIQGEAPQAFEPGKIYLFECWATWCAPCIASIPHLNEIHKKYHDKGLRVYGMTALEEDQEKVEKFVKSKGDGMSYPVAFTGKGSAFETEWYRASEAKGIPTAFIVKDGKLLLTTHPGMLNESALDALVSGDEGVARAMEQIKILQAIQDQQQTTLAEFQKAAGKGDVETMIAKIDEFAGREPDSPYLALMKFSLLMARNDWPAVTKAIEEAQEDDTRQNLLRTAATKLISLPESDFPVKLGRFLASAYTAMTEKADTPKNPLTLTTLCYLQWKCGDKEAALATAKMSFEIVKASAADEAVSAAKKLPVSPFERFAKAVEEGNLPPPNVMIGWIRAEMPKAAPPAAKPEATPAAPDPAPAAK
jgi:thiol-disulfide isomerase/thioredoxin